MTYRGHVKNGQIALDEPVRLPEGAEVQVAVVADSAGTNGAAVSLVRARRTRRIQLDTELARQIASLPEYGPDEF